MMVKVTGMGPTLALTFVLGVAPCERLAAAK